MSNITILAADSTQSELKDNLKGKKHKRKEVTKKKKKKDTKKRRGVDNESASDYESDLDLEKELKSIGGYLRDRDLTIEHMFRSISTKKLKAMLPEILKPIPLDELKKLCVEQMDCMSRKRIRRILEGANPETISSSGTEEDSSLSDEDKTKHASSDEDNAVHSTSHKDDDSPIAIQSETTHSPVNYGSRSRSRSPLSGSGQSRATSRRSSYNSQSSSAASDSYSEDSESDQEVVEEVVYEEIILEQGEDLESILGHGSYIHGTRDSRLKTVSAHQADDGDDDDVMVIEREERHEQPTVIDIDDDEDEEVADAGSQTVEEGKATEMETGTVHMESQPASQPGSRPSSQPGSQPSSQPGSRPSSQPGSRPSSQPGSRPGSRLGSPERFEPESPKSLRPGSLPQSAPGSPGTQAVRGDADSSGDMDNSEPGPAVEGPADIIPTEDKHDDIEAKTTGSADNESRTKAMSPTAADKDEVTSTIDSIEDHSQGTDTRSNHDMEQNVTNMSQVLLEAREEAVHVEQSADVEACEDISSTAVPVVTDAETGVADDAESADDAAVVDDTADVDDQMREQVMESTSIDQSTVKKVTTDHTEIARENIVKIEADPDPVVIKVEDEDDDEDEKLSKKRQREEELEEGELLTSSEDEAQPEPESEADSEAVSGGQTDSDNDTRPVHKSRHSHERKVIKVKGKRNPKKKRVKVIKRIIKVIRRKPGGDTEILRQVSRDGQKKLKVSDTKHDRGDHVRPEYMNVKVKQEPGLDATTSVTAGTSAVQNVDSQSKQKRSKVKSSSSSKSSSQAKVKDEPKSPKGKGVVTPEDASLNKMEILELEMRARAIKAMLKKQEHIDQVKPETKKKKIKLKR